MSKARCMQCNGEFESLQDLDNHHDASRHSGAAYSSNTPVKFPTAPERPFKEIAYRLAVDWTSTRSRERCTREIESALTQATKEKDEEIERLKHALSYANTLNADLLKEVQALRDHQHDETFFGRHRKP